MSAADHLKNIRERHESLEESLLLRRPSHVDRGRLLDALERVQEVLDDWGRHGGSIPSKVLDRAINDALEGK